MSSLKSLLSEYLFLLFAFFIWCVYFNQTLCLARSVFTVRQVILKVINLNDQMDKDSYQNRAVNNVITQIIN